MKFKIASLLLIISLSTLSITYGAFDMQAWMEKVYLNHQSKALLKDMVKGSDKGADIHESSVELARQNSIVSITDSINQIISMLKYTNNQCSLSYNDVTTLLVKNKDFKRFLYRIRDTNSDFQYTTDDSNFVSACIRYLNCSNATKKTNNTLTASEYSQCTNELNTLFQQYYITQYGNNQLDNYSYGDELFSNGTLEDSSFDLMYDIEQINKVLYANPKRIPSNYLRGPPNYLSKQELLVPVKIYASNGQQLPSIEQAIQQIKTNEQESNIVANLQCFDPAPIIQSDDAKIFKAEIQKINKGILNLEEDKLIDDVIAVVSQPFLDTPKSAPNAVLPQELLNPGTETDTNDSTTERGETPPTNGNSNSTTNTTTPTACPVNDQNTNLTDASWNEITDVSSDKLSVGQCLGQCQACEEGAAKRACFRKCLCNSFTNENQYVSGLAQGLLGTDIGMKLCLVASTTPDIITPGTQVVSIQEIINQIAAIMAKLKASGEYLPSSKPSEFFSPTSKIGKLSNLLNFNINITSKSKYRIPDKKVDTANTNNYFDTQVPDIGQLQISSLVKQQAGYKDFMDIHQNFRDNMEAILKDRNQAAKNFYDQVK